MRTLLFPIVFLIMNTVVGQTPAAVVHDPTNNAQLVTIGTTMADMSMKYDQITKRLETVEEIKSIIDTAELLASIEQSACVIKDLDYYWDLAEPNMTTNNSNCFGEVNINMAVNSIKNALSSISAALSSSLYALNERSEAVTDNFKVIQDSTKELFEVKEDLRKNVESKEEAEEFLTLIYGK